MAVSIHLIRSTIGKKQAASLKDFTLGVLVDGVKINTSATDFAPIEQLQMQKFTGEKWERFGPVRSGESS